MIAPFDKDEREQTKHHAKHVYDVYQGQSDRLLKYVGWQVQRSTPFNPEVSTRIAKRRFARNKIERQVFRSRSMPGDGTACDLRFVCIAKL